MLMGTVFSHVLLGWHTINFAKRYPTGSFFKKHSLTALIMLHDRLVFRNRVFPILFTIL